MESKSRPNIFAFKGWLDVFFVFLIICIFFLGMHTHGYTEIISFWLLIFVSYFYGLLSTLLFPDFYKSKITRKGKMIHYFICLFCLLMALWDLWRMMKLWNGFLESHFLHAFSDFIIWLLICFGLGFSIYKGDKSAIYKWVNPKWRKSFRKWLGIETV